MLVSLQKSVFHGRYRLCWSAGNCNRILRLASEDIHNRAKMKPVMRTTVALCLLARISLHRAKSFTLQCICRMIWQFKMEQHPVTICLHYTADQLAGIFSARAPTFGRSQKTPLLLVRTYDWCFGFCVGKFVVSLHSSSFVLRIRPTLNGTVYTTINRN